VVRKAREKGLVDESTVEKAREKSLIDKADEAIEKARNKLTGR
jgi:SOS response regulatory protein OraA/RecX